ncbi:hypothetical protein GIB67_007274 [Kingdonia uniflora]|uniref:DUF4283 domain-containing protein n=1 Tax=Kingdonia uniflora TaxID=39325 RepID=A0A7J7NXE0_9MAGN|nr:hypothetical protein GIB67_007274 [Kingdonia uniflora]
MKPERTKMQECFQPGYTPVQAGKRRFLYYNMIGCITTMEHEGYSYIEWSMRFESDEVKVVALGTCWVAAITSLNYLRIFTDGGLQVHSNSPPTNSNGNHDSAPGFVCLNHCVKHGEVCVNLCHIESRNIGDHNRCAWVCSLKEGGAFDNLPPPTISASWASMVSAPSKVRGRAKLEYTPLTVTDGKVLVKIKSADFDNETKECANYLVGHFMGKRMGYLYVKETLNRLWELKGDFDMSIRGRFNLYFFKFHNEEDRAKVLELGSQHVASRPFVIREWRPFIEYEPIELKTIPLWVIFKEILEQFWNSDGLGLIASAVGKPMFLDKATEENKKRAFARICVEVGADNILPKTVNVLVDEAYTIEIPVEYNWLPTKCEDYVLFGHNKTNCPVAANSPPAQETINPSTTKTRMKWIPKAPNVQGKGTSDDMEGWEQPKKTFKASMSTSPSNITTHNAMQALDSNNEENNTLEVPN